MSSFVISKEEYVKAAGLVAGIAKVKKVWVYDYEARRNSTETEYYKAFCDCFTMNALSVQEQYGDETLETDGNDYKDLFTKYVSIGVRTATRPGELKNTIMELHCFFSSAAYQTEKESYYFKMQSYFNQILVALMPYLHAHEAESWGSIAV